MVGFSWPHALGALPSAFVATSQEYVRTVFSPWLLTPPPEDLMYGLKEPSADVPNALPFWAFTDPGEHAQLPDLPLDEIVPKLGGALWSASRSPGPAPKRTTKPKSGAPPPRAQSTPVLRSIWQKIFADTCYKYV